MKNRPIPMYIITVFFFALVCGFVAAMLVYGAESELMIWFVPILLVVCMLWAVMWIFVARHREKRLKSIFDTILNMFSREDAELLKELNGSGPSPEQISSWICEQKKIIDRIRFNSTVSSVGTAMSRELFWQISDESTFVKCGDYWENTYGDGILINKFNDIRQLLVRSTQEELSKKLSEATESVGLEFVIVGELKLTASKTTPVRIQGRSAAIQDGSAMVLGTVCDLQAETELAAQLECEKIRSSFLLDCTNDVIYEVDVSKNRLKSLTPKASMELFGIENMQDFDGERRPYWELIHNDYREGFVDRFFNYNHMLVMPEHKMRYEYKIKNRFGDYIWVDHLAQVLSTENGNVKSVIARIRNINREKRAEYKKLYNITHDSLTGAMLSAAVAEKYEDVHYSSKPHCAVLFNINRFRYINSEYGREAGDKVLLHLISVLWENHKGHCIVGRISDDCFIVAMTEANGEDTPQAQIKNVLNMFTEPINIDGRLINVTLSASCSDVFKQAPFSYREALRQAEFAMAVCKHIGTSLSNSFVIYNDDLRTKFPQLDCDKEEAGTDKDKAAIDQ